MHCNKMFVNKYKHILILIPLILSAFTHLWNAVEFPSFHIDEGVYIRRALHVLSGLGPQDPDSRFDHPQDTTSAYDHPYFGQVFLAAVFKLIGYPQNLLASSDFASIQKLFTVPRLIMGAIAVIDTFLVYKIGERRFNPTVALFASLLFAVMPSSWFTRRVVLDSIMLPFILASIFLALEIRLHPKYVKILSFLSGISLGLAIFTKIPSFVIIPLIIFLINQGADRKAIRSKNGLKIIAMFLLPVFLIPLIWPTYAFLSGDFNQWVDGVLWQATHRETEGKTLTDIGESFLKADPLLLILGTVSIAYLTIRREYIAIIWIMPFLTLLYLIGWVNHFHLILVIPILCISLAKLIYDLPYIVHIKKRNTIISISIITGIVLFGLISTFILISTNLSYIQLKTASYISNEIVPKNNDFYHDKNKIYTSLNTISINGRDKITVITGPLYSWVYKYVFGHQYTFSHIRDTQPIKTEKIILLVDRLYKRVITGEGENQTQVIRLSNIYNNTDVVAVFEKLPANYTKKNYPFTGIDSADSELTTSEIRANY